MYYLSRLHKRQSLRKSTPIAIRPPFSTPHFQKFLELGLLFIFTCLIFSLFTYRLYIQKSAIAKKHHHHTRHLINTQIELYFLNTHGKFPKHMDPKNWHSRGGKWPFYFSGAIPQQCPHGTPWMIDPISKKITLTNHKHHE